MSKSSILTPKQNLVREEVIKYAPRIIILHGAKRSGKTFVNNIFMLGHIGEHKNEKKNFIIIGATTGSVWRNVLKDWEKILNIKIHITKDGSFELFGNYVYIFGGEKSDSWKKLRGMTSAGTYINEATALHQTLVEEAFSRTSEFGSRIFIDTNPDNPNHFIKKNYIDKAGEFLEDGRMNIYSSHFVLEDNTRLDPVYIQSIKNATPSGATYDRDINGLWVATEGLIYRDFNIDRHVVKSVPSDIVIVQYYFGIDWGYDHYGTLVVIGLGSDGTYYLVEVLAKRNKHFDDYWRPEILKRYQKYKPDRVFVDGARAEYLDGLRKIGIYAENADKNVKSGIDYVGSLFKMDKLKIIESAYNTRFKEEIYAYVWGKDDQPKKEFDDVLDALRYSLYSQLHRKGGVAYL